MIVFFFIDEYMDRKYKPFLRGLNCIRVYFTTTIIGNLQKATR